MYDMIDVDVHSIPYHKGCLRCSGEGLHPNCKCGCHMDVTRTADIEVLLEVLLKDVEAHIFMDCCPCVRARDIDRKLVAVIRHLLEVIKEG